MLIKKEILRKMIHLSSVILLFFDNYINHELVIYSLFLVTLVYFISELLRVKINFHVPIVSDLTEYCSYTNEKKSFVYSPLIFSVSILFALTFFPKSQSYPSILALGLGDGMAALIGNKYGKNKIFYNKKKTLEGSISMFLIVFLGSLVLIKNITISFIISVITTLIESFSNEATDNLTVPFSVILLLKLIEKIS